MNRFGFFSALKFHKVSYDSVEEVTSFKLRTFLKQISYV
jgi:hypothetical protein